MTTTFAESSTLIQLNRRVQSAAALIISLDSAQAVMDELYPQGNFDADTNWAQEIAELGDLVSEIGLDDSDRALELFTKIDNSSLLDANGNVAEAFIRNLVYVSEKGTRPLGGCSFDIESHELVIASDLGRGGPSIIATSYVDSEAFTITGQWDDVTTTVIAYSTGLSKYLGAQ